jgi:protein-tyrosine phosphatase
MLAKALPDAHVDSAGLGALVGKPAAKEMQQAAEAYDVDLSAHRGRQLFQPQLEAADIVFVMEKNQREHLCEKYPHIFGRVFLLSHFSPGDRKGKEIADPYRMSQTVFDQCAGEIAGHIDSLAGALALMTRAG